MLYSLAGGIQQIVIIIILRATSGIDISFTPTDAFI